MTQITKNNNDLVTKLKDFRPKGFEGFSVYEVFSSIFKNFRELRFFERAAAISFNFVMAIAPSLIFFLSLVPFLPLKHTESAILGSIHILSPDERLYQVAHDTIIDFLYNKRRELLSFGFVLALFFSSNGMMGIIRSFDMVHPIYEDRTGLKRRGRAILLTLILMIFSIIGIALLIIQTNLVDVLLSYITTEIRYVKYASFLLVLVLVYFTFCIVYTYAPSLKKRPRFFSVGAFWATIAFIGSSYGFFFIATHFINYNQVYGPLGTLIVLMIWINITAITILAGFEINSAIMLCKREVENQQK